MSSENFFNSSDKKNKIAPESTSTPKTEYIENYTVNDKNTSKKSRLIALLLGIFFGHLGVHNFYLGKIAKGIIQAVLTISGLVVFFIGIVNFTIQMTALGISEESELKNLPEEMIADIIKKSAVPISVCILFLTVISIWSFIDWIMIAAGAATDSNGKTVKNW